MQRIDFGDYQLEFAYDFIKITFGHECHFDTEKFDHCFDLKKEIYGLNKIGVLVNREDPTAIYSFDPLVLVDKERQMENHTNWLVVISNDLLDYQHLEFVKQMTAIPCSIVKNCQEAKKWIASTFPGPRPNLQLK